MHEAFNTYVAQVAEVTVKPDGCVNVDRVVCAVDCGIAVDPDNLRSQVERAVGFALGLGCWLLKRKLIKPNRSESCLTTVGQPRNDPTVLTGFINHGRLRTALALPFVEAPSSRGTTCPCFLLVHRMFPRSLPRGSRRSPTEHLTASQPGHRNGCEAIWLRYLAPTVFSAGRSI